MVILCFTTIILAFYLRKRARSFTPTNSNKEKKKDTETRRTTTIIFTIMIVFLIAEIQDGIAFIIYACEHATDRKREILSEDADIMWDSVSSTVVTARLRLQFLDFLFDVSAISYSLD